MIKQAKIFKVLALIVVTIWVVGFILFYKATQNRDLSDPHEITDGMVVLTGGPGRIEEALKLMEAHKAKRLLISGVHPDVIAKTLQTLTGHDKNLFDCCIDIDHKALDTAGNAIESAAWAKEHNIKSLTIVTANYHMPRSMIEFRRHHSDIILMPHPVASDVSLRYLLFEYHKYLYAILKWN